MSFRFEIVDLCELDAEPPMADDDWAGNASSPLARGDREKALAAALSRIRATKSQDRAWVSATSSI